MKEKTSSSFPSSEPPRAPCMSLTASLEPGAMPLMARHACDAELLELP